MHETRIFVLFTFAPRNVYSLLIFKGGGKLAKKFKTRDYIEAGKMGTTFQLRFKKTLNPGIGVYSTLAQCYFDRI